MYAKCMSSGACVLFCLIWLYEMLSQLNNKMGMENPHLIWGTLVPNVTSQTVWFLKCWMMGMADDASWLLSCIPHLNSGMLQITLGNQFWYQRVKWECLNTTLQSLPFILTCVGFYIHTIMNDLPYPVFEIRTRIQACYCFKDKCKITTRNWQNQSNVTLLNVMW